MSLADRSFLDLDRRVVGLVGLVALGAVVAASFAVGTAGVLSDTYEMSGVFEDAGGLREGGAVEIAGVEVGSVTSIDPDFERGQVVVTWEVDREVEVATDSHAEIRPSTLLGGSVVRLWGEVREPLAADVEVDERRIPLERTSTPANIVDLVDDTTATLAAVDTELLDEVTGQVGTVLDGAADDLPELFRHLGELADVMEAGAGDLEQLVDDGEVLTRAVLAREDELDRLLVSAGRLLRELTDRRDELAAVLGEGHDVVVRLTDLLARRQEDLAGLSADLHAAVEVVGGLEEHTNRTLSYLGPAFEQLAAARGDSGEWVEFVAPSLGPFTTDDDSLLPDPWGQR
jgi:phospholipid/cholesterol/gamma-HCH transport system substrate-binding protein